MRYVVLGARVLEGFILLVFGLKDAKAAVGNSIWELETC